MHNQKIAQLLDVKRQIDSRIDEEILEVAREKEREDFDRLKESLEYIIDENFRFFERR